MFHRQPLGLVSACSYSMLFCRCLFPGAAGAEAFVLSTSTAHSAPSSSQTEIQSSTPPPAPLTAAVRAGWVALNSSVILYDSSGTVVQEIGLGSWDEDAPVGGRRRHIVNGAASRNGQFAWSWEKVLSLAPGREDAPTEQSKILHFWGTEGQELWRDEWANAPEGSDPAALSPTGEHILVIEGGANSGTAVLYDYMGNRLLETRGTGPAEFFTMSTQGKFALVRWHMLDQAPTYTIMDNQNRIARTIPPNSIIPGPIRLDDDGKVFVGKTLAFDVANSSPNAHPAGGKP